MQLISLTDHITKLKQNFSDYPGLLKKLPTLSERLDNQVKEWEINSRLYLRKHNPFYSSANKFERWQQYCAAKQCSFNKAMISDFQDFCHQAGIPFEEQFWQKELEKSNNTEKTKNDQAHLSVKLLLEQWQKKLDAAQTAWQLDVLEQLRQESWEKLKKWLDTLDALNNRLEQFGLETGIWFDNSIGELNEQNINEITRWLNYLSQDKGARKVAELLGKMRQSERSIKIEKIKQTVEINVPTVDIHSNEEIIGLRLGNSLEHALPSELALIADPELSVLFDLKYLENKLICFELQGLTYQSQTTEEVVETETSEEDNGGPMILCIDTSGSMQGVPENIAKAMALYLGNKARSQKRPCFIINFSTRIETFEINEKSGISDLLNFLKRSFHGGTDVAPALNHAVKMLGKERYKKADVLVISDFIMSNNLSKNILDALHLCRQQGNRFNSLIIGSYFMNQKLPTHFDREWVYNPQNQSIDELVHSINVN